MSWVYNVPMILMATLIVLSLLAALEAGHRLGRRVPVDEHQVSTIAAPILALVSLLLAFSFSMAGDRHAMRRAAAVAETNAIRTFWLRTSLLPEPIRSEMQHLVRRYVDLHIEHRGSRIDQARTAALESEASRLQQELWALLIKDARASPEARPAASGDAGAQRDDRR